jgi:peroxiredoxin
MEESQRLSKKLEITFPIGADPELRLIRSFGVEMEGREIAIPSMFVLERGTGRIIWRYIGETMFDRPKLDPVLKAIEQAGGVPHRSNP